MVGDPSSTHPPLPPTSEDERLDWLRLLRSRRVGAATFKRLLGEHGSARAALRALPGVARAAGVEGYAPCPEGVALAEYRAGTAAGARLLARGEPAYPAALSDLSDAPPLLWAMGDVGLLARPMVALVGARNASSLGLRMARALSEGLREEGIVVVSGLARGIDTAAHQGALPATIAVMAGGVDHVYPEENAGLAAEIAARGLRLSENPVAMEPQARHFPARNRIVSGLALATVVVEAAERSGSLITARSAADQGRDVLAVPGHPMDPRAAGCNLLIRDGATLVRGVADVLEALGPSLMEARAAAAMAVVPSIGPPPRAVEEARPVSSSAARLPAPAPPPPPAAEADLRARVLDALGPSPVAEDQVIRDVGAGAARLAPTIIELELEGRISRHPGGLLSRVA